jgi:hypothetical protein
MLRAIVGEDVVACGRTRSAWAEPDSPRVPRWLAPGAALGMAVLAFSLRHYGVELIDEGTLLAQFDRVHAGQWPYRDFHTGYAPLVFWLNGGLLRLAGAHLDVVRLGLLATHAVALGALASLAARAIGWPAAVVVVALTVSFFLPVAPGAFCLWNIPYPGWYAHACGAVALLAALGAARSGRRGLALSGLLWGVAFGLKQNTGVLGLAAVIAWRAVERSDVRGGSGLLGGALAIGLTAGAVMVVSARTLGGMGDVAIAVPVVMLAARVARLRPGTELIGDAAALVGGFLAAVVPLLLGVAGTVGWPAVAAEILHLGSGAAAVYAVPYPSAGTLAEAVAHAGSAWRGLRQAADLAWFVVLPVAHAIAVATLRPQARSAAWRLLVCAAVLYYVQLFPRADFWHLVPVTGPSLVLAVGLAVQGAARSRSERRPPAGEGAERLVLATLLIVAVVRLLPTLGAARAAMTPPPAGAPSLERATIRWDLVTEPRLRAIPDVTAALDGADGVVGFPALGLFGFLTGKPSPLRHDYFFPGVPSAAESPRVLAGLAAARSARVVVLREDLSFFAQAFRSHADVVAAIESAFPRLERIGPYEVRSRVP